MPSVYSTITNDTAYCHYIKGGADLPSLHKKVVIKGGANRGGKGLITPMGVRTEVTDEDLEFLEANQAFMRHKSKGFITVVKAAKADPEKVAKDMEKKDKSAPLSPGDFDKEKAPKVGNDKPEKTGGKKAA